MCKYWSGIATKDGRVLFYEGDDHEEIIKRSGLSDGNLENREFVRIEVPDADMKQYKIDEDGTLPRWFEKRENEFYKKVELLLSQLKPLKPKRDAIDKEYQTKRDAIDKEYQPKWDAIFKEYQPKKDAIFKEYQPKRDAIYKEYQPKWDAIYKEYQPKRDAIYKEYHTKRDAIYGKIKGYLPKEQTVK